MLLKKNNGTQLYCDTDSLFFYFDNDVDKENFIKDVEKMNEETKKVSRFNKHGFGIFEDERDNIIGFCSIGNKKYVRFMKDGDRYKLSFTWSGLTITKDRDSSNTILYNLFNEMVDGYKSFTTLNIDYVYDEDEKEYYYVGNKEDLLEVFGLYCYKYMKWNVEYQSNSISKLTTKRNHFTTFIDGKEVCSTPMLVSSPYKQMFVGSFYDSTSIFDTLLKGKRENKWLRYSNMLEELYGNKLDLSYTKIGSIEDEVVPIRFDDWFEENEINKHVDSSIGFGDGR